MYLIQQRLFRLYVVVTFFIGLFQGFLPHAVTGFVGDVLFIFLFLNLSMLLHKLKGVLLIPFLFICLFLLLSSLYSFLNGNPFEAVILSLRNYKNFFLCFIILSLDRSHFNFVLKVVLVTLILSVPISFYQFKTADLSNTAWWDEVGGALGRDGQSGTLSLLILTYVVFEYFRRLREKKKVLGLYMLLSIPMLINETKIVIFIAPLMFLYMFMVFGSKYAAKIVVAVPSFLIAGLLVNLTYFLYFDTSILAAIDSDFIYEYFFIDEEYSSQQIDIGRGTRMLYAIEYLQNHSFYTLLFGEGLGSTFYGENSGIAGIVASEMFYFKLHEGSRNQIYQIIIDFGLLGLLFFISVLLYVLVKIIKSRRVDDVSLIALITIPLFLFACIYQMVVETRVIFFLMCYSVILYFSRRDI